MSNIEPYQMNPFNAKRIGFKSVKDLSESTIMHELSDIIKRSHFESTTNIGAMDEKMLFAQSQALRAELKGRFEALTLLEVKEAFRLGIRGESGPYFGLCAKTYHQFLKWYFDLPERGKAWTEYLDYCQAMQISDKPVYYTEDFFKKAAVSAFEDYKLSGKMPYTAAAMYNVIKEQLGVETLILQDDWNAIRSEGIRNYESQIKEENRNRGNFKRVYNLDLSMDNSSVKSAVMKVALRYYFDRLIENKQTLEFNKH